MKKIVSSFVVLFCLYALGGYAQKRSDNAIPLSFPDSVRIVLENTKNVEASVIGASFASSWGSLTVDQQQKIQQQLRAMRKKKMGLKPNIINYLGAVANAVNIERASASTISSFLDVTTQVIENENSTRAQNFFRMSRVFFQHHALYYDKTYRLRVTDDQYTFSYITPAPAFDIGGGASSPASDSDYYGATTSSSNDDDTAENLDNFDAGSSENIFTDAPLWMNPPPQPIVEGPVIAFSKLTLTFVTKYDSASLRNSKGSLSLRDFLFVGEGGNFDWTPALIPADVVSCELMGYNFDVRKPYLRADLSKLTYANKTPGPVPGTFEFKSIQRKDSVASTYPRFKSYQSTLEIQGLADQNVRYKGGFSLIGNKISSACVGGDESKIEVFNNGEKKFEAKSCDFIFTSNSITAEKAKLNILHKRDSITHPAIRMKYTYADTVQKLLVRKDKGGLKHTPYSSSFFSIDFAADIIRWDLKTDSMNIQIDGARNTVPLVIESTDYYDPEDFRLLKGEGFTFHPAALFANYCIRNNVREFYSGDLMVSSGRPAHDIKAAVQFLKEKGLITYDAKMDKVTVKEKLITIYRGYKGEMDYDNLKILSVIDSLPNASLNFKEGYLKVRGVEEFKVSDSLNVRIEPDSSIITLLQNRDIKFNGTINAGNFQISGKGFTLNYNNFSIDLNHIDSINFFVTEKNARGQSIRRKINNSMVGADSTAAVAGGLGDISKSSGTLYISAPNNKSGKSKIPNYPRLDASTGGVIYFDREEVLGGAYDRSMFFVVPPFNLDSLNDADPASINFEGSFISSGMFPKFREKLHTQPDKSLGFAHKIPASGYELYQGNGKMYGTLNMDNQGLRGTGDIKFLAVTLQSNDFIFYPDSVVGKGENARIEQQQFGNVLFPDAKLINYDLKWMPKQDRMNIKNKNAPFEFYNSTAQMRGTLTVSKEGVAGAGKFETRGTELVSKYMNFTGTDFRARRAKFKVKSDDPNKPLLTGTDVRMRFNLEQNYADISPEVAGVAAIDFPFAQFKTSISSMRWDVSGQKITMRKDPDQRIEDSYFYTTRKDLDSLNFNAEKAVYDLKTQELKVSGIPYIKVADAMITPENNEVLILENARIGTLKNTTIVLDTLNAFHRLTQGVVDIKSRKEFAGHATYQYVNFLKDTFAIKMTDFHLVPVTETEKTSRSSRRRASVASMQTTATGKVSDKDNLVLGAGMFYKGDMNMFATRPALQLDGFVKLDIRNMKDANTWIHYTQTGEETEVMVNFDKATTEEGEKVNAGIHFNGRDNDIYITFLNNKKSDDDEDFFLPSGMLYYDTATREFKIEDIEKARGNKLSGKVFAYNDNTRQVRFEGPMRLFRGMKDFNIVSSALGQGNIETNEIKLNSFLIMETNIPTPAFDAMGKQIADVIKNEGADEGLGDQTELLYKIADIIGERAAKDYEQRSLQSYVSLGTIPQLVKPIVFSNVNLKWSPERKRFYSEGKLGISNIGRTDINGAFDGFMEIGKNEDGGPIFNVFIKASPEAWYFFGFEDNRLLVHTSSNDVNTVVSKKSNAGKAKIGEVAFIPGTEEETLAFINRFRKTYYGIDIPYSLYDGVSTPSKKSGDGQKGDQKPKEDDDGF